MVQELWTIVTFSELVPWQRLDQWKKGILKSPELDVVNINVYAKFDQTIPYGSRDRASLFFFFFFFLSFFFFFFFLQNLDLGKASTDDNSI